MNRLGRPRNPPGEAGQTWLTVLPDGRWRARAWIRDTDGRRRRVQTVAATKGAAKRGLGRRLDARTGWGGTEGVHSAMTVDELAEFWLELRAEGTGVGRGRVSPQTLGGYENAVRNVISPALGGLHLDEINVGRLDHAIRGIERSGRSTRLARTVLSQMMGVAVRHGAIPANPMRDVTPAPRPADREIDNLSADQARRLRMLLREQVGAPRLDQDGRRLGGRPFNADLADFVDLALGTGARIGELLALRWSDVDLAVEVPTVRIAATMVEPRPGHVDQLLRQEATKSRTVRTLLLPDPLAATLRARRLHTRWRRQEDPVLASSNGSPLWPHNVRNRLRTAVADHPEFAGVRPHTLRRTVGTLLAHRAGLDAARDQLGHTDPGVTFRYYVGTREVGPDVRGTLTELFEVPGLANRAG